MRNHKRLAVLLTIALIATSCGPPRPPQTAEPLGQTILVVENQSTLRLTVYVLRDSHRQRLGIANALSTTRLRIPNNVIFGPTALRFEVHPLGSSAEPISERITVSEGDEVRMVVPSTLR